MTPITKSHLKFVLGTFSIAALLVTAPSFATTGQTDATLDNMDFGALLNMKKTMVDTLVEITWSDGTPVVGAKVFDHRQNTLLGVTDRDGKLLLNVLNGTLLRLVEPDYGQQQSLRLVQGKKKSEQEMMAINSPNEYSVVMAEGWTL